MTRRISNFAGVLIRTATDLRPTRYRYKGPTTCAASDPQLVVEIALDGVQSSTRYAGGVALRFARVKRYRPDKDAAEADTIEDLRALLIRAP